jgi:hypothetical protein
VSVMPVTLLAQQNKFNGSGSVAQTGPRTPVDYLTDSLSYATLLQHPSVSAPEAFVVKGILRRTGRSNAYWRVRS